MKTRLYHKLLKMAIKEICSDPRPSVQDVFFKIYCHRIENASGKMPKLIATEKTDRKALFAYVAWHEKVGNNNEHDRYFVKEYIRDKYKRYSRKYWTPEAILKRMIATGSEK